VTGAHAMLAVEVGLGLAAFFRCCKSLFFRLPLAALSASCRGTRACSMSHVQMHTAADHFAPASAFSPTHAYSVTFIRVLLIITV